MVVYLSVFLLDGCVWECIMVVCETDIVEGDHLSGERCMGGETFDEENIWTYE